MSSGLSGGSEQVKTVSCARHGDRRQAFVCEHLLHGIGLGFFFDRGDHENPYPDAWCSACEQIRRLHGGWNDESEALVDVRLVCGECYEEIKANNAVGTEDFKFLQ
jgi:hypothetical protein